MLKKIIYIVFSLNGGKCLAMWKRHDKRYASTSLFQIHTRLYRGYIQEYRLGVPFPCVHHVHAEAGRTGLHRAPPELWCRLAGGKVRGPTSVVVTADGAGTVAVETKMAPLVEGVQKFSPRPEKWIFDRCLVAPEEEKV
jgi:hypothetical protein